MKSFPPLAFLLILACISLTACGPRLHLGEADIRVATFNVSIEATNYLSREEISIDPSRSKVVQEHLASGNHSQIQNIAEIIQRTRPDILLLNEFDYIADPSMGVELFIKNYLNVSQNGQHAINYPYYHIAPVNTGLATPFDLDNDGQTTGVGADAQGFGYYSGQYAMALLSRYPIKHQQIRTLQTFLWKDMPNALQPKKPDGTNWYSAEEWSHLRLSSKSHWDIPIATPSGTLNIIAAHPTPPTFDGAEDRNGKRNHDEIRLISDYLSNKPYLTDDSGISGGIKPNARFVVMGDLNSSPNEGDSIKEAINNLLDHPLINDGCVPTSNMGQQQNPDNLYSAQHTAAWGLRVDYVLPSKLGVNTKRCGVYWPSDGTAEYRLVTDRQASSDHRLVWVDLELD